jgi:hypothetical protein
VAGGYAESEVMTRQVKYEFVTAKNRIFNGRKGVRLQPALTRKTKVAQRWPAVAVGVRDGHLLDVTAARASARKQAYGSTPARRSPWTEAVAQTDPEKGASIDRGITHYARGLKHRSRGISPSNRPDSTITLPPLRVQPLFAPCATASTTSRRAGRDCCSATNGALCGRARRRSSRCSHGRFVIAGPNLVRYRICLNAAA